MEIVGSGDVGGGGSGAWARVSRGKWIRGSGGLCGERWAGRGGLADWAGRLASWVGWPGGLGGFFFFFLLVCFSILFLFFFSVLLNFGVYEKPKLHLKYF